MLKTTFSQVTRRTLFSCAEKSAKKSCSNFRFAGTLQADQVILSVQYGAGPILIRPFQCSSLQIMDQNWHFLDSKYDQEIICQKSIFRRLIYYTLTGIVDIYVCVHNKTVNE